MYPYIILRSSAELVSIGRRRGSSDGAEALRLPTTHRADEGVPREAVLEARKSVGTSLSCNWRSVPCPFKGRLHDTSPHVGGDDTDPLVVVSAQRSAYWGGLPPDLANSECESYSLVGRGLWHVLDHRRLGESLPTGVCRTAGGAAGTRDSPRAAGSDAPCPRVSLRDEPARAGGSIG